MTLFIRILVNVVLVKVFKTILVHDTRIAFYFTKFGKGDNFYVSVSGCRYGRVNAFVLQNLTPL